MPDARHPRTPLASWGRLLALAILLALGAAGMVWHAPQRWLADEWPGPVSGPAPMLLFALAYGLATALLMPRPVLNLAAGALLGTVAGLVSALAGTVLGAALSFGLGRLLGQDALRRLMRGRWLRWGDRQLSQHGFRSTLVLRLLPGVPFALANYAASASTMSWAPFVAGTALGSTPLTAAYVVAGSQASTPASPAFITAGAFVAVTGLAAAAVARRATLTPYPGERQRMRQAPSVRAGQVVRTAWWWYLPWRR